MAYRVIQWASGSVGVEAIRDTIGRSDLELVGVYVYSKEKAGVDAGTLAGLDPIGVKATNDRDEILALEADCVLHSPSLFVDGKQVLDENDDDVEALLRSGKNVVSVTGYVWPESRGSEITRRLEDACAAGNSTLFGTGLNPGMWLERIGPAMTAMCRNVDGISIEETWDATTYPSWDIVQWLGFGQPSEMMTPEWPAMVTIGSWFAETMSATANALNIKIDRFESVNQHWLAERDLGFQLGKIEKGTISAVSQTWSAISNDRPVVSVIDRWVLDWDIPDFGGDRRHRYVLSIDGTPSIKARFDFEDTYPSGDGAGSDKFDRVIQGTTASIAVNSITAVCEAPPGILRHKPFGACVST